MRILCEGNIAGVQMAIWEALFRGVRGGAAGEDSVGVLISS